MTVSTLLLRGGLPKVAAVAVAAAPKRQKLSWLAAAQQQQPATPASSVERQFQDELEMDPKNAGMVIFLKDCLSSERKKQKEEEQKRMEVK